MTTIPAPIWKRHAIDSTSRGADGVKLGDLNRDGLPDVVTGWEEGGEVRVYLNPGPTAAKQPWPRVTVGRVGDPEEAIFADLDGDGRLEVISGTEGKTRTVFCHRFTGMPQDLLKNEQWQTAAFPVTQDTQLWMQAVAMDVDGQPGLDLVLAAKGKGATIGWLQAPAKSDDLKGWTYHSLRPAGWIMSLIPHDMDDDGDQDIMFTDRRGERTGAFWLENPGTQANRNHAAWREHAIGATGREVMFADVADVNRDGRMDVAVAVKPAEVVLCLQQAGGQWRQQSISLATATIGDAKAVKVADINGDARPDLFFTCENAKGEREGILWLEQTADGNWAQHPLGGPEGLKYDLMQVLDLDADGDLDVMTCEEADNLGVMWYENPGPAALAAGGGNESPGKTRVTITYERWHINGRITHPDTHTEGLLMNVRMVNATFEDTNPKTCPANFDPDQNTAAFIARIPDYAAHGMDAFTLCLQGGMPNYEGAVNSAFNADGTLRPEYLRRVQRVIEACDRQGLAVILGLYYQRQSKILRDEAAVRAGVVNVMRWIQTNGFENVLVEIANEYPHSGFVHPVIRTAKGQASLIQLAKTTAPNLLVTASGYGDGAIHPEVAEVCDFLTPHWNGTKVAQIPARLAVLKKYRKPIVVNEDDKVGAEAVAALKTTVENGASYGLMLKETNQYHPFHFAGAADDPVFYGALKVLTGR